MNNIKFIPQNQKNIDKLEKNLVYDENIVIIRTFSIMFILYIVIIALLYWFFIFQKNNQFNKSISELDAINTQYYPKGSSLEQSIYNVSDLIKKSYDPTSVIRSIEAAYIPNSKVSSFTYSKLDKIIVISMTVTTISDSTLQVQKFSSIEGVAKVDFSSTKTISDSEASFEVKILLN